MDILGYILLIIGLAFNVKLCEWVRLEDIGFRAETPEGFLRNPNAYVIIDIILFVIALIFVDLAWYIIVVLYFLSFIIGRIMSENKIREVGKDIGAKDEEVEELIKASRKRYPHKK